MSTPASSIFLCSGVPLNSRYEHSIYFPDVAAQSTYFDSKVVMRLSAYTFLRRTWPLKVKATMAQARKWNYLFFHNGETGKVYYYFVNSVEYKSDQTVELSLELDVLQTYMFDYSLQRCFVERHHVSDDVIGKYTMDEGLDLGELIDNERIDLDLKDMAVLTLATFNPNYTDVEEPVPALGYDYGGVFSGLSLWASIDTNGVRHKLELLSAAGFADGIIAMWLYPKNLIRLGNEEGTDVDRWAGENVFKVVHPTANPLIIDETLDASYKVDGYMPNNNKLLTYPFNTLYATNNNGGSAVYRFERFRDGAKFRVYTSYGAEGMAKLSPQGYNESADYTPSQYEHAKESWDYGLTLSGFPQCAWESDVYKMWLAQNQSQHAQTYKSAVVMGVGGAVTAFASAYTGNLAGIAGGAGAVYGAYQQIQALNAQKADMEIQPPQSRGSFTPSVNIGARKQTFTLIRKSVSAESAKRLDDYFTMFGYKLNELRKPNPAERDTFTYIKTVGCHIKPKDGKGFCNEDTVKIEGIFDKGVTWWMDGDEVGNYSIADKPIIN